MGVLGGRGGRGPGRSCDVLEGNCTLDFLSGEDDMVLPVDKDADVAVGGGVWRRHGWGLVVGCLRVCKVRYIRLSSRWVFVVRLCRPAVFSLYTCSSSVPKLSLPLLLMDRRPGR